jgi:CelD/BcsL family acetyltransferase involved in cellulose biosynthesis
MIANFDTTPFVDFTSPKMLRPPPLRLRIIESKAELFALAGQWDALLARCAVQTPFMTWDWISIWWDIHADHCHLMVTVLEHPLTKEVMAIAPLMIARERDMPRRMLRQLTFIGCLGESGSQGMDFIVPAGDEDRIAPLLCEAFHRTTGEWDVINLPTMHEDSRCLPHIRHAMAQFSGLGERAAAQNSYVMSLPDSWDEQMALWRSKERVIFRSKWNKLMSDHNGRAIRGESEVDPMLAFSELWRLHSARFDGEHSCFLNTEMEQLHRRLIARWAPLGKVMLPLLEADGKIIAARYGLILNNTYWSYQAGYDPEWGKLSVGKLSLGWAAQCVIEGGVRNIDHMPGDELYKQEWSTRVRRVVHLETFNPTSIAAIMFRKLRSWKRNREPRTATLPSPVQIPAIAS